MSLWLFVTEGCHRLVLGWQDLECNSAGTRPMRLWSPRLANWRSARWLGWLIA
jgi:hypothetical protein